MSDIWDYSGTPSANTSLEGTNVAPGMSPANVDDAIRILTAILRNSLHVNHETFLRDGGALPVASGGTAATNTGAALSNLGGLPATYKHLLKGSVSSNFGINISHASAAIACSGPGLGVNLDPNSTTPIATTDVMVTVFKNYGPGNVSINPGTGVTLYVNGGTTSATATIAPGGVATLMRWAVDDWTITGVGVS